MSNDPFVVEFDLRAGPGVSRVLMRRQYLRAKGPDKACWKDIARFDSYNEAEWVLRLLRKASK